MIAGDHDWLRAIDKLRQVRLIALRETYVAGRPRDQAQYLPAWAHEALVRAEASRRVLGSCETTPGRIPGLFTVLDQSGNPVVEDVVGEVVALVAAATKDISCLCRGLSRALEGWAESGRYHLLYLYARQDLAARLEVVDGLRAENTRLRAVLGAVEWIEYRATQPDGTVFKWRACPRCGGSELEGHAPDCELDAVLGERVDDNS